MHGQPPVRPSLSALVAAGAPAPLAGIRVLVVEDEADSRELLCAILQLAGATALGVESVAQAMNGTGHSFDPDVVVTDYAMPGADGFDLIRQFRQVPSTRAIPILILSGHTEDNWRERALAAGAVDVLTKPSDPDFLVRRIVTAAAGPSGRAETTATPSPWLWTAGTESGAP